ncbi:MAG: TM0106 family RecB-like putative nuclease [Gemmatimonadaceae bacterium]
MTAGAFDARRLYSAKDLLNFLGCEHSTALDLVVRTGQLAVPEPVEDEYLGLLKNKGITHEECYLASLREQGKSIREIARVESHAEMAEATREAMREGVDVIYQGALFHSPWHGYSDFLLRVEKPSRLGAHSYEVADTKLARSPKPKHVFQLCLYSMLVALDQELEPGHAHIILGDNTSVPLKLRDYVYYVDAARERFQSFASEAERETQAERCAHCGFCRWAERCDAEWEAKDDLRLVARLSGSQARKLIAAGVGNLRLLAELNGQQIPGIQREALEHLKAQARLQLLHRTTGEHRVELLPLEVQKGFARLPRPNDGDLFFDMEGDPVYSADGSLEYLFGFHHIEGGEGKFTGFWAHDRVSERTAFENALDFMTARVRQFPDAFIYHYASYEETALKRLAQKYGTAPKKQVDTLKRLAQEYGTRENEVDDLLRSRKLVDLYKVVRESVQTSEPAYSLKNMEVFFAPERTQEIRSGGDSIVAFERWLVLRDDAILEQLEEYNAFDCRSTMQCRDWLLSLRPESVEWFDPNREAAEQEAEQEQKRRESDAHILTMRGALVCGVPDDQQEWRLMLGHLLEYHRREARREWWRFFERLDARVEDHIDDVECIGGITVDPDVEPRAEKRSKIWTLRFPEQETKLRAGKSVKRVDTKQSYDIVSIDEENGRLELKVGPSKQAPAGTFSLIPEGPINVSVQRDAIERYAQCVIDGRQSDYGAVTSILRRDRPRLRDGASLLRGSEDVLPAAVNAVVHMDDTHLVIQGPPGTGKTFTSAHAIVELLRLGKRVGVTALSHKAINNLLASIEAAARKSGVSFHGVKKSGGDDERFAGEFIDDVTDNKAVGSEYQLIAGTAWLFSRPELDKRLDHLFIDEAGQISLATCVAVGGSAHNIVLVGDQMQLAQPAQGAHPSGSGVSVLDHLMQSWPTVPPDRGIFLARTWRMHPEICRFVSDAFYEGRLEAAECTAQQKLILEGDLDGVLAPTGLRFVEVQHGGNTQRSEEEALRLSDAYRALIGQQWVNEKGETAEMAPADILVVSPYNMQVNLLKDTLPPNARVGTVDKFQGQEAAVVLISLASSTGENIPHGLEFLFSRNRLNVAISRARCLSVIFASPTLLSTPCNSVRQVRLVNTLCWTKAVAAQQRLGMFTPPSVRAVR